MKYQIVIQLPEQLYGDLDRIAKVEDTLDEHLINAEVDGHDIGSGEVNIFIHTDNPMNTFNKAKNILEESDFSFENVKIAYREIGENQYTLLWPEDLTKFKIK